MRTWPHQAPSVSFAKWKTETTSHHLNHIQLEFKYNFGWKFNKSAIKGHQRAEEEEENVGSFGAEDFRSVQFPERIWIQQPP